MKIFLLRESDRPGRIGLIQAEDEAAALQTALERYKGKGYPDAHIGDPAMREDPKVVYILDPDARRWGESASQLPRAYVVEIEILNP